MTAQRVRWIALGAALLVLAIGFWASSHQVTLLLNGEAFELQTQKLSVGGALEEAGIQLQSADELQPGRFAILREGMQIQLTRATRYQIWDDDQLIEIDSTQRDPLMLLADAGLELGSGDRLRVAGAVHSALEPLPFAPELSIELHRAKGYTLQDGDEQLSLLSSAGTVGELLSENGIQLYAGDRVQPDMETTLDSVTLITLQRARPFEIRVGDQVIQARSAAETVGAALADAGLPLLGLDRSQPAAHEPIPESGIIEVIRVEERVEMSTSVIPFSVEWQGDPNTEIDERSVIQPGQNGVRATSQRVLYENGEEVSRVDEGQWTLSEPVTQISGFGTKIVVRTAVVDGVEIEYWRTLELFATSYSPCRSGVETCYYYTALGDEVKQGIAAVYLSWWYAMGQHTVYVPGYGPAKISDNGAYPDGRPWIDLGYSDEDWVPWAQWVTVYFTTPIPPEHEILYLLP